MDTAEQVQDKEVKAVEENVAAAPDPKEKPKQEQVEVKDDNELDF